MVCRFSQSIPQPGDSALFASSGYRTEHRGFKHLLWIMLLALLYCPLMSAANKDTASPESVDKTKAEVKPPNQYTVIRYNSGKRPDPFLNPLLVKKSDKRPDDEEISRGAPPAGIGGTYIAQATLKGIAIRDSERIAVLLGSDSRAYFLRRGDRLFDGYIKEIQDDSVTLVRETKMKSGKILTQDVIKRLRTP